MGSDTDDALGTATPFLSFLSLPFVGLTARGAVTTLRVKATGTGF